MGGGYAHVYMLFYKHYVYSKEESKLVEDSRFGNNAIRQ